jgi:hypothetical protein
VAAARANAPALLPGIQSFDNFGMNFKKSPKIFYSAAIPLVRMALLQRRGLVTILRGKIALCAHASWQANACLQAQLAISLKLGIAALLHSLLFIPGQF